MYSPDFCLTNRDEAFLLLGELDLGAQLLAVRSLERHLGDRQTYKLRRSAALAEWQMLAS